LSFKNGVIGTGWKTWFTVTNPSNDPVNVVFRQQSQDPNTKYGNLNLWVSIDGGTPLAERFAERGLQSRLSDYG
jgi:hypothetical protein